MTYLLLALIIYFDWFGSFMAKIFDEKYENVRLVKKLLIKSGIYSFTVWLSIYLFYINNYFGAQYQFTHLYFILITFVLNFAFELISHKTKEIYNGLDVENLKILFRQVTLLITIGILFIF